MTHPPVGRRLMIVVDEDTTFEHKPVYTQIMQRALDAGLAGASVFVSGSAVAFALEGLVVAVQALRLEYYELFSRMFAREGRPFRPWSLPLLSTEEAR